MLTRIDGPWIIGIVEHNRLPLYLFVMLALINVGSPVDSPTVCRGDCIVQITGMQASYRESKIEFALENTAKRDIIVVVVLDGSYSGEWQEEVASVFDPNRPLAAVVRGKRLKAGERAKYSFDPEVSLSARARVLGFKSKATSYQLRVEVRDENGPLQTVVSKPFRLSHADTPKR